MDYRCNLGHRWRCNGGKKLNLCRQLISVKRISRINQSNNDKF
jgi:hypothetical protein